MPFYLTRDPVPSADMRNVFDNAQNLDLALNDLTSSLWTDRLGRSRMSWFGLESAFSVKLSDFESRFTSQIVEQEATFDASQADKENRFQHFLVSSGYVFLGDYENGPFQFSARNQYIRYNNQYYRLNAATNVGFTTTGTDATSFANDVTHFVLMDGDTLRQNLGSSDGLKWIGKCKDLSTLRTIEPTISGQSIILERAVVGGPLLNVILTNNPAASDAVDDGYSRFVTAGGAVWDADISFGHNVFLAGYSDELNNLADCLNMIIQDKVNKVISRGYVAGGVDSEIRIPPNPNAEGVTNFYMNKKSVKIPSFLRVHSAPAAIYDYSDFTTGVGIIGSNEFEGLTNDMMYRNNGGGWG
ncbi:hypothetical protein NXG73_28070, partial [Klebsiella pneumoniae]|nr:hypothetical protein [Klebsiella pneumoniae]MDS7318343.1 hypothetical protein [Klebsiella pneumoniae]MDS7329472.1 hypothetical protein [Klebsiella pneumoniae]